MRNKRIADNLLIILFIVFFISILLKLHFYNNFYLKMLDFVIEAALVGSIADWFAVTALFKKPLGFSWHTAVIPRNRIKVVDAIVNVVENELLSKKILEEKINRVPFTDNIIKFIEININNKVDFNEKLKKFGENIIKNINPNDIALFIEKNIKNKLKGCDLSLYFSKILKFTIENEYCNVLFKSIIEEFIVNIKGEKVKNEIGKIIDKIMEDNINKTKGFKKMFIELALGIARGTNSINVDDIASSIQKQIVELLHNLKDEHSLTYIEFINKVEILIGKLKEDEELINSIEKWKQNIITQVEIQKKLEDIIKYIYSVLKSESVEKNKFYVDTIISLIEWTKNELNNYWDYLKTDDEFKSNLDKCIKELIYDVVKSNYDIIGTIIKRVLNGMTDESLNSFIQLKVGNELNWIRINGCIIGAIFGVIVFLFINQIYLPLITKLFHL